MKGTPSQVKLGLRFLHSAKCRCTKYVNFTQKSKSITMLSSSDLPTLHQLVARLLSLPGDSIQVIAGQLPEQLPVALPLPDGVQVIGSVVREQNDFQILFDVALSPQQVKAFYRQQLLDAGWKEQESFSELNKGFANLSALKGFADQETKFSYESQGAELVIETLCEPNNPTFVKCTLNLKIDYSLSAHTRNLAPLPPLESPPNVQVHSRGTKGSTKQYSSQAQLETELDAKVLIAHYADQFEQAGWTQRDSGQDGALIWSSWTLLDNKEQSWLGLLNIMKIGGLSNQYFAFVQVLRQ